MSTTLTNGIIIPENGSRNWGGDLANNWNILDLNVGYMNDVKTKVTTLETTVAENTANIQTNASNISALQTSKQDVIEDLETIRTGATAGATAVQPSALSNYVDLNSQIILAKNLTGANIAPGGIVDCGNGDGNGKLQQLYINENGSLMSALPFPTGIWKSTSFITISPNDGAIFIKIE